MPRYLNGVPIARGQAVGAHGALEEQNRRTLAAIANDRFVAALAKAREEEYQLAATIDAEIHLPPNEEELTAFEIAMARVRQGAGISIVRPIRRPEPMFTLGGVSEL